LFASGTDAHAGQQPVTADELMPQRRTAAVEVNQLALAALSEAERPLFVDMPRRVIATMGRDGSEPESR
jgi:hypothetical protein